MFARHLLPAAVLVFPFAAMAQGEAACDLTDDQTSCSRVLACFGEAGRWFEGRAFGRETGTVAGVVNDGVSCFGTWATENGQGQGEARVTCDDGMNVTLLAVYQDYYSGTAIWTGISADSVQVRAWSGLHVIDFLRSQSGSSEALLPCGGQEIPIS
jgi:hypothetical protein